PVPERGRCQRGYREVDRVIEEPAQITVLSVSGGQSEVWQTAAETPERLGPRTSLEENLVVVGNHTVDQIVNVDIDRRFERRRRIVILGNRVEQGWECAGAGRPDDIEANSLLVERAECAGGQVKVRRAAADEHAHSGALGRLRASLHRAHRDGSSRLD